MHSDTSILNLVLDASLVVQLVMASLLAASVYSWFTIIRKRRVMGHAESVADKFESAFWSGSDLSSLYRQVTGGKGAGPGMPAIFESGFREFSRLSQQDDVSPERMVETSRRAMRVSLTRETDTIEQGLASLATIGSTSPYVGLFGTVWGIMNSFTSLGANTQTATLQAVAPGIAEALVATAMGLFAAIPAVIFYNRYADKLGRIETRFETFVDEFLSILERHAQRRVSEGQG
ncbi:MAG: protein TolQ [Pseudomonadota bacterium]